MSGITSVPLTCLHGAERENFPLPLRFTFVCVYVMYPNDSYAFDPEETTQKPPAKRSSTF
jgi:hypothetical protein